MKRTFGVKTGLLVVSFMALLLWTNLAYRVSAQSEALNSNSDQQVSTSNSIAQLNEEAAILYRQALENNIEEVRGSILRISKSLEHISFEGQTTVEGIHALSETIVEVKQAVVKVKNDGGFSSTVLCQAQTCSR